MTTTFAASASPVLVTVTVQTTVSPRTTECLSAVLVTVSSEIVNLVLALAVLFVVSDSGVVVLTVAVLVFVPAVVPLVVRVSVAVAFLASVPMPLQVPAEYEPSDALDETRVRPAGRASATLTLCAGASPRFLTVTVQTTLPLTSWVGTSTDFVTVTSALVPVTAASAWSLAELVSFWSSEVRSTLFVLRPVESTVVLNVSVAAFAAPTASDGIVQTPEA